MSRIGKLPVELPAGVKCELNGTSVKVSGPKGTLEAKFSSEINIALENNALVVTRPSDKIEHRSLHGLTRALLQNMVTGVVGIRKTLQIEGTGYRASIQGKNVNLQVGYSHPVVVEPRPESPLKWKERRRYTFPALTKSKLDRSRRISARYGPWNPTRARASGIRAVCAAQGKQGRRKIGSGRQALGGQAPW